MWEPWLLSSTVMHIRLSSVCVCVFCLQMIIIQTIHISLSKLIGWSCSPYCGWECSSVTLIYIQGYMLPSLSWKLIGWCITTLSCIVDHEWSWPGLSADHGHHKREKQTVCASSLHRTLYGGSNRCRPYTLIYGNWEGPRCLDNIPDHYLKYI